MVKNTYFFWVFILIFSKSCYSNSKAVQDQNKGLTDKSVSQEKPSSGLKVGAADFDSYASLLKNKKVAVVANQGSVIYNTDYQKYTHLIDTLKAQQVHLVKVFSPEHGFRGKGEAGESVQDMLDVKTGLPVISLYGTNKKPKPDQLKGVDIVLFDLQDVGVRFYTYISTLHYVMEACAEQKIPLIVLDRPNPNAHYVDGPVLENRFQSFVGMHPVPVVYGMTIGEYALMINGEKWLENGLSCNLQIIKNQNYTHTTPYQIPVKPSPNLPNTQSINLYPSLCFFEGTNISCGRGTDKQFQIFGSPDLPKNIYSFTFTPEPNEGAKTPLFQYKTCYGMDLENSPYLDYLNIEWLQQAYQNHPDKEHFFNNYFNNLAGNNVLKEQIVLGYSIEDIRKTWQPQLEKFKKIRKKYLLYP